MSSIDFEGIHSKLVKFNLAQDGFILSTYGQNYCITSEPGYCPHSYAYNSISCVIEIKVENDSKRSNKAQESHHFADSCPPLSPPILCPFHQPTESVENGIIENILDPEEVDFGKLSDDKESTETNDKNCSSFLLRHSFQIIGQNSQKWQLWIR
jgi:hypothetical protein